MCTVLSVVGDPCTIESQPELAEVIRLYFAHNVIEVNVFGKRSMQAWTTSFILPVLHGFSKAP